MKTFFFITISFLLMSCKEKTRDDHVVSVSILPQKYFIERIAGDFLNVNVMIPPGMSPAACDFTADHLKKLNRSKIYFAIGYLPFELGHLYPVLKQMEGIEVINHSANLKLISGHTCSPLDEINLHGHNHHAHENGTDPHIWVSPHYARAICLEILNTLVRTYPEKEAVFRENFKKLEEDITGIDDKLTQVLAGKKHITYLIYHPAYAYLAEKYGLKQVAIEDHGKEPGPEHLKNIIEQVKQEKIHVILIQHQFDIKNAQSIAEATGCQVISVDPLNENWLEEMNHLITVLDRNFN